MWTFEWQIGEFKQQTTNINQNLNKYDSFWAMKIKDSSLFKIDFLKELKEKITDYSLKNTEIKIWNNNFIVDNEWILHWKWFTMSYAKEYSYIRVYLDWMLWYPLNIDLNKWTIYVMDAKDLKQTSIELLEKLKEAGILQNNIPYISDEKIKKLTNENNFVNDYINNNNSTELPFNSTIDIDPEKTMTVLQKGSIIINDPIEWQALYTFWAGPCLILSVYDKDTWKIWLAHIDATIKKEKIISFLSYFSGNPDITIISWDFWTSSNVLKAIKSIDLVKNISFMNSDLHWNRNDAVAIRIKNWKPDILYWYNPNIKLTNSDIKKLKFIWFQQWWNLTIDIK